MWSSHQALESYLIWFADNDLVLNVSAVNIKECDGLKHMTLWAAACNACMHTFKCMRVKRWATENGQQPIHPIYPSLHPFLYPLSPALELAGVCWRLSQLSRVKVRLQLGKVANSLQGHRERHTYPFPLTHTLTVNLEFPIGLTDTLLACRREPQNPDRDKKNKFLAAHSSLWEELGSLLLHLESGRRPLARQRSRTKSGMWLVNYLRKSLDVLTHRSDKIPQITKSFCDTALWREKKNAVHKYAILLTAALPLVQLSGRWDCGEQRTL